MCKIKVSINHCLTNREALRRVKSLLADLKNDDIRGITAVQAMWSGDTGTFSFRAIRLFIVSGTLNVSNSQVNLEVNLPLFAVLFKGKIESNISEYAQQFLQ